MANFQVQIHIKDLPRFERAMANSPKVIAKHLQTAVSKATMLFARESKDNIRQGVEMWKPPIDTGQMFNSIYPIIGALRGEIKVGSSQALKYAPYVHEGTSRMQARPFFEITARTAGTEIDNIFNDELNSAMKEIA